MGSASTSAATPRPQNVDENHVRITAGGIRFSPIVCRLIWPSEMNLMARLAGLRLTERWEAGSGSHSAPRADCT